VPTPRPNSAVPEEPRPDRNWAQLELLGRVQAMRDLRRFRTTVAIRGSIGTIVGVRVGPTGPVYTVRFTPAGLAGASVTFDHLTGHDVLAA